RRLALVLTGKRHPEFWGDGPGGAAGALDFHDLKGVIEALAEDLHLAEATYRPSAAPYLHPGRAAALWVGERLIGHFGQMHPKTAEACGLGARVVLAGELDIELLQAALPKRFQYGSVPTFPAALRDIAIIVPEAVTGERIVKEIRTAGSPLLCQVR